MTINVSEVFDSSKITGLTNLERGFHAAHSNEVY